MPLTPTSDSPLLVGFGTHAGESGKHNEDRCAVKFFRAPDGEAVTLAVVCDGIGGNRAGEVAAELAVTAIASAVAESEAGDYRAIFTTAIDRATASITEQAQKNLDYRGMGTTCAIAVMHGWRLYTGYVGDSRLYVLRRNHLQQISVDHTWLQAALEHKIITPGEAANHPNAHVLLQYINDRVKAKPDLRLRLPDDASSEESESNQGLRLEPGEAVLLCSDGLSDVVSADDIEGCLKTLPPQRAVDGLIELARKAGGPDNITAIVLRVPETE
ncbi:MAG: PP2C family protein-serine/threonine phosphatase [Anaerolineales bacterium]